MSWRQAAIIGLILGLLMASMAYFALNRLGVELQNSQVETSVVTLKYQDLILSPGIEFDMCGLTPPDACRFFTYVSFYSAAMGADSSLKAVQASQNSLQPFGMSAEDDLTADMILQPTDFERPMVTMSGRLLQYSR